MTSRLGVGPGDEYSDSIVEITKSPKSNLSPTPVLGVYFLRVDLELLIVESNGGFRRVLADNGNLLGAYGVFFGVKKDKHLEGIYDADVSRQFETLAVTGSLQGMPYEVDLRKLSSTQPSTSYVVLDDWLTRLNLMPGTSFVAMSNLYISKSEAASGAMLHYGDGRVKKLRYCSDGKVLVGITDDGRLVGWKRYAGQMASRSDYVRLGFRDGRGGFVEPGVACAGEILASTTPSGRYGNLQLWNSNNGEMLAHFEQANISFENIALDRSGTLAVIINRPNATAWRVDDDGLKRLGTVGLAVKQSKTQATQSIQNVSISDDGSTIAFAGRDEIFVLDLPGLINERQLGASRGAGKIKIEREGTP